MTDEECKALIRTAQYKFYKTYVEGLEKEFDELEDKYNALKRDYKKAKRDYDRLRETSQKVVLKNKALQTVVEKLRGG